MSEPTPFAWLRKSSLVKRIRSISSCRCWTCKGTQETNVSSTSRCLYRAEQSAWVIWQHMTRYSIYYFLQKTDNCKARSRLQSNGCKAKQELQGVDGFSHFSTCCHGSFDPNYPTRILQDSRFLKHCSKWQKDAFQPWIARRRAALSQRFSGQILSGILRLESARVTKSARERVTDPQTTT